MHDLDDDPETPPPTYECLNCGAIVESDSHPVECDNCGSGLQNRAISME